MIPSGERRQGPVVARFPPGDLARKASTWPGDLAFAATVAVLFLLLVVVGFPEVLHGALLDTDGYMRVVRVRQLVESGGWFDPGIPRSNAPFGSSLHWTRPVDVLLLFGAWLATPVLGFQRGLHLAAVLISPALLIVVCLMAAWCVRPIVGRGMRWYTMLSVLAQVGIMGYALPGRPDHNTLILLAFVGMFGSALRLVLTPGERRWSLTAGAWAGFGLWVSTEFLAALLALLLTIAVLWVVKGGDFGRSAKRASLGLFAVTLAAVLVERGPADLLVPEFDRLSIVHLFVTALVAVCGVAVSSEWAARLGPLGRTAFAAAGTVLAAGLVFLVFPRFFGGPMVDVHPELKATWLPFITEFQVYLDPRGLAGIGRVIAYLGQALLALAVAVQGLRRDRGTPLTGAWTLLLVSLVIFIPLGVRWVRFVTYAEMLGVVGTIFLLSRFLAAAEHRFTGRRLALARAFGSVGLIVGPKLLGAGVMVLGGETGEAARRAAATQVETCPVPELVSALTDPGGLGDRPRIVLAHMDLGPELLYRTRHSVVATPYHRNWQGILDWQAIMGATDPDRALGLVRQRGIDVVVVCSGELATPSEDGSGVALAYRLLNDRAPEWLRPIDLGSTGLRVYEVVPPDRPFVGA